jgi:uncharacterized protein (DUF433 family)
MPRRGASIRWAEGPTPAGRACLPFRQVAVYDEGVGHEMSTGNGSLYGGVDPADFPAYTIADAARFLHLPYSTLKFWVRGGSYDTQEGEKVAEPVIEMAGPHHLSFQNLGEAHIIKALRRRHGVSLPHLRQAIQFVRDAFHIAHPLTHPDIRAAFGHLLLDHYGQLIDVSAEGQVVIRETFEAHLRRLEWGPEGILRRLYPFVRLHPGAPLADDPKIVSLDPRIGFGRPIVPGGIRTRILIERFEAGDSIDALADDYERPRQDIEEAIRYETAVRPYEEQVAA